MWKPLEVATNPSRFIKKYGVGGLLLRSAGYPLRPVRRLLQAEAVRAQRRHYQRSFNREAARLPQPVDILFYPTCPPPYSYAITKMLPAVGYRIVTQPTPTVKLAIAWLDETHVDIDPLPGLRSLNHACKDISKVSVSRAFEQAFGYGFHVDPTTHDGPMVEKSDDNFKHDGKIIQGPAPALPGRVYQRVIDNRTDRSVEAGLRGDEVLDIRTPVIGNKIPLVYLKFRPVSDRFGNSNTRAQRYHAGTIFSPLEVQQILSFCRIMGLDYGELDILRDRADGRVYIVDVNKTPAGPPNGLSASEGRKAMRELGRAFAEQFISR